MKQVFVGIAFTISLIVQPAFGQVALYEKGSIFDLEPPSVQSTGSRILEQVLNSNDMQQVSELATTDILRKLARPVGRLAIQLPENRIAYCTASLIDRDHIITNYHCVPGNGKVQAALLWMGYLVPRSRKGVAQYAVNMKPVEASEQFDYSILRVSGKPGDEWGSIPLSTKNPTAYNSLFIVHHPGGFAKHISRGRCQTSDPALDGEDVLHICDTLGGSSGAPIFDNNTRKVIGLHYSAVALSKLNAGKRIASIASQSGLIGRLVRGELEAVAWAEVRNNEDIKALETYLGQFPDGKFSASARLRIANLKEKQLNQLASRDWKIVEASTSITDLESYTSKYPNHAFSSLARFRIKDLQQRARRQEMLTAWNAVKASNSVGELQAFIDRYPESLFAGLAADRIVNINRAAEQLAKRKNLDDTSRREQAEKERLRREAEIDKLKEQVKRLAALQQQGQAGTPASSTPARSPSPVTDADLAQALQIELKRIGCYTSRVDGDWGRGSARAVSRYNKTVGANWDGALSQDLLAELKGIAKTSVCKKPSADKKIVREKARDTKKKSTKTKQKRTTKKIATKSKKPDCLKRRLVGHSNSFGTRKCY